MAVLNEEQREKARVRARAYYWANREACLAADKQYRQDHPDRQAEYSKRYYAENLDHVKRGQAVNRIVVRMGVTREEAEEILATKIECCEICGATEDICEDHCHAQLKHRGWLCRSCNRGLGYFADDPERLRQAARYLEENG